MKPILFNTPAELNEIELYVIHDLHMGNYLFDGKKWDRLKKHILETENAFCLFAGDAMENAVPGSKSDVFSQLFNPEDQKEWFADQLKQLADRTVCVIDGNHERNRSTKLCGLYPLYDCCQYAGIKDRYRPHFAFADIGVGSGGHGKQKQIHYVGYIVHRAKDLKNFSTADMVDGIDFMVFGHDHDGRDHPRARLSYDSKNKSVSIKSVETINSGSFLNYGGYAADGAYRPNSPKMYKMILSGQGKKIDTVGFYI